MPSLSRFFKQPRGSASNNMGQPPKQPGLCQTFEVPMVIYLNGNGQIPAQTDLRLIPPTSLQLGPSQSDKLIYIQHGINNRDTNQFKVINEISDLASTL